MHAATGGLRRGRADGPDAVLAAMKTYFVKEIFYTLQGEGAHAGRPAVFLRFSGCNLWTGLERDRDKGPGGCSRWCDTDFVGGMKFRTAADLFAAVVGHWPRSDGGQPFVVCTGGE